jgi:hypothetical protein
MKQKLFISSLLILSIFISCSKDEKNQKEFRVINQRSVLEDSSFISFTKEIRFYNNKYYIPDFKNCRILVLNTDLYLIQSIGKYGQGPGEFNSVGNFFISEDSLYAYDPNKNRVLVFNIDGTFNREIKNEYVIFNKFVIVNNKIISNFPYSEKPILVMDINGKLLKSFGKMINKYDNEEKYSTNQWDILTDGQNIIAVNLSDPFIDVYDFGGKLLNRTDLTNEAAFSSEYEFKRKRINEDPKMRKSSFQVIKNSFLKDDNIYLLYHEIFGSETYAKKLLIFNYKKNLISNPVKLLSDKGSELDYVTSLAIHSDTMLVFEITKSELIQYKIK